jgi:hypothetical protein
MLYFELLSLPGHTRRTTTDGFRIFPVMRWNLAKKKLQTSC